MLDEPQHRVREDVVEALVGRSGPTRRAARWYEPPAGDSTSNGRPPASSAFSTSSSVIAEAIHIASRCEARPVSAVTSPPLAALDLAVRAEGDRPAVGDEDERAPVAHQAGSAAAAAAAAGAPPFERRGDDLQVVAQVARHEEVLAHVLLAAAPERLAERGVLEDVERALGALLDVVDEVAGDAVLHLQRDAADVAADERPALPDRLADRQAEALARRLLDQRRRRATGTR